MLFPNDEPPDGSYLMAVIEGQSPNFTVIWVGILLGNVPQGTMGDVRIRGYRVVSRTPLGLTDYFLCDLP